jgi:hypothetical protein
MVFLFSFVSMLLNYMGGYIKWKRRDSRLAVSTFNRFKQKEKVSQGLKKNIL